MRHVRRRHHRRRHVGPGGRHSAGHVRPAASAFSNGTRHRRAEFVLSPGRPQLRRRPARGHQLSPARRQAGPAGAAAAAIAHWLGRFSNWPSSIGSAIAFPGVAIAIQQRFGIACRRKSTRHFPAESDNYQATARRRLLDYDDLNRRRPPLRPAKFLSTRSQRPAAGRNAVLPADVLRQCARARHGFRPVLRHVPRIFLEGLARPRGGVRVILKNLVRRFKATGRRTAAAGRRASGSTPNGHAPSAVVLDDGTRIAARRRSVVGRLGRNHAAVRAAGRHVVRRSHKRPARQTDVSSNRSRCSTASRASWAATTRSSSSTTASASITPARRAGRCAQRRDLLAEQLSLRDATASDAGKVDPAEGMVRVTALANFDRWAALPPDEYQAPKAALVRADGGGGRAVRARFPPARRGHDMFTPTTIRRFTGHDGGAVYGAPQKRYDATTHLKNLFICGTDQGLCRHHRHDDQRHPMANTASAHVASQYSRRRTPVRDHRSSP